MSESRKYNTFTVSRGTNFQTSNGTTVILEEDTRVSFEFSETEEQQIGQLLITGKPINLGTEKRPDIRANNYEINRERFSFKRDPNGKLLGIDEQLEEGQSREDFIAGLTLDQATAFNVKDQHLDITTAREEAARLAEQAAAEQGARDEEKRQKDAADQEAARLKKEDEEKKAAAKKAEDDEAARKANKNTN